MTEAPPALIAIVDDEASVRKALLRLFRSSGFDAREFISGVEFLKTLPFCRYDCLVLDLHMPGLNGIEVQRDIAMSETRLPIVIITAHDEPETREKCLSVGASAYLCKPFDDNALLDAVVGAIGG